MWTPVFLAAGIGAYFAWGSEPARWIAPALTLSLLITVALSHRVGLRTLLALSALSAAGFGLAQTHTHLSKAPVLTFRYYGPVQGRVIALDRSVRGARRVTLDEVVLLDVSPAKTPRRVRVSLYSDFPNAPLSIGDVATMTAHLSPPTGPAEPGGFDFRRHAWFQGIGAVGYTRVPALRVAQSEAWGPVQRVNAFRMSVADAVRARLPTEAGGLAAALITGDRSGVSIESTENLRRSNLSHLLAISGLHMGLLTGFVFGASQLLLRVLWPSGAAKPQKLAAILALIVGAGYLAMSGMAVASLRAYIMVAVMYAALLLDRQAVTLYAVALAALIILVLRPEALIGPGFQMSFAATVALVVVFNRLRGAALWGPFWLKPVWAVVISSLVAGFATAPIAAAHFNRFAQFGLMANLTAVPMTGTVVIPAGAVAAALAPFGLEALPLWIMERGCAWILRVAETVSNWPGAVRGIKTPGPWILPVLSLSGLVLVLWRKGPGRYNLGPALACGLGALAFGGWSMTARPTVLISQTGGLIGVQQDGYRALSRDKGE
ncbi:MAG: ComEC/Rec2 family competence protein, partial [Pseudomonadota bacterium]